MSKEMWVKLHSNEVAHGADFGGRSSTSNQNQVFAFLILLGVPCEQEKISRMWISFVALN